jgi:hypothetical protein
MRLLRVVERQDALAYTLANSISTKCFIRNFQIFHTVQGLHFISGIFDKIRTKLEAKCDGFLGITC